MSLRSLCRHPVTISRYVESGEDGRGNPNASFVDDRKPTLGFMQPDYRERVPDPEGVDTVFTDGACFFPPEVLIDVKDQLKWDGQTFRILGIRKSQRPGATHHLQINLRAVG